MVEPARKSELAAAFRMVFRHLPRAERDVRVANALALVAQDELDPRGVMVARADSRLTGAMVCVRLPGAGGLVWPPQALPGPSAATIIDLLVRGALSWLRAGGAKVAHAILAVAENSLAEPLVRNGFRHITRLWYLRHDLTSGSSARRGSPDPAAPSDDPGLTFETFARCDPKQFARTLQLTYEGTLDCPELNGVRTVEEIIAGHQGQGSHDPNLWWLVRRASMPLGVLLLTEMPEWDALDIAYLGVIPAARGQGLGRILTAQALAAAHETGKSRVTLAVDARNLPAWNMYLALGFEPHEEREVYLFLWPDGF
jgi:ribosomal protein S18 acetylase RimI-like enzyme